ncbi:MAG: hypothetical protein WBW33_37380 [Bryobacteraceae bacterium]
MKIFTIENETNNITVHATPQSAEAVANAERFRNEAGLQKLAADWPAGRLGEIFNSLPGASPVKKFKDRQAAVSRIWKAIQSVGQAAPAADEVPTVADVAATPDLVQEASQTNEPEAATATPVASQTPDVAPQEAPATKKTTARKGATKASKPQEAKPPRESSKTGWQKHTVLGFVSLLGSKGGEKVESSKDAAGERTYRIAS